MSRARILISGNFHWHGGFSQTVAEYMRAAEAAGCEIRVIAPLSRLDVEVPRHLPVVDDLRWGTHVVFMFEARQFLSPAQIELARSFARARRVIIDFDAHWGAGDNTGGDSPAGKYSAASWHQLYSALSDLVLQPRVGKPLPPGATFFKCFGLPSTVRRPTDLGQTAGSRDYEMQYIGSNWWRWKPLAEIVEAAARAQPRLSRLRVCGHWWDNETCPGFEDATFNEPNWLRERGVDVQPPVPFGQVVPEMGRAVISPILVRPLVVETGLLTPRMFETLASGSLPALPTGAEYVAAVYGDGAQHLMLGADPSPTLARMISDYEHYASVVARIQDQVRSEYSYQRVLADLLGFLCE